MKFDKEDDERTLAEIQVDLDAKEARMREERGPNWRIKAVARARARRYCNGRIYGARMQIGKTLRG